MRRRSTPQAANVPASKRRFTPHQGNVTLIPKDAPSLVQVSRNNAATSRFRPHGPVMPPSAELILGQRPPGPSAYASTTPMQEHTLSREPIRQLSRAHDLFDLLKDDPSPHALCPGKPE